MQSVAALAASCVTGQMDSLLSFQFLGLQHGGTGNYRPNPWIQGTNPCNDLRDEQVYSNSKPFYVAGPIRTNVHAEDGLKTKSVFLFTASQLKRFTSAWENQVCVVTGHSCL